MKNIKFKNHLTPALSPNPIGGEGEEKVPAASLKKIGHPIPEGARWELFLNTTPSAMHQPAKSPGRLEWCEGVCVGTVKIGLNIYELAACRVMGVRFGRQGMAASAASKFYLQ